MLGALSIADSQAGMSMRYELNYIYSQMSVS